MEDFMARCRMPANLSLSALGSINPFGVGIEADMKSFNIAIGLLSLLVCQAALAQGPTPAPPRRPTLKTCRYMRGHPSGRQEDCTSAVLPNSSVTCSFAIPNGQHCHLIFGPSGTVWSLSQGESAGNGTDSTVQMTCDATPAGPNGAQCVIEIRPHPDYPTK